jgi:hypothetical protein
LVKDATDLAAGPTAKRREIQVSGEQFARVESGHGTRGARHVTPGVVMD